VFAGCVAEDFLNDSEMVPLFHIGTGTGNTFAFKFYMRCISLTMSLNFRITLSFKTAMLAATWLHSQL
jgi:hypothetical protein